MIDPRIRNRTRKRRQIISERKINKRGNWFLTAFILVNLGIFLFILFFVRPELIRDIWLTGLYLPFFLSLAITQFSILYLLLKNIRQSFTISLVLNIFLYLRLFNLGYWYNGLLLFGLILLLEFIISPQTFKLSKKKSKEPMLKSKPEVEQLKNT